MTSGKRGLQRALLVWHPGDRVTYGGKQWYFTAYMKNGAEQWVRPDLPEMWTELPPVYTNVTALDKARLAGPDRNHRDSMYRLLADMRVSLISTKDGRWTVDGTNTYDRPEDAIYTYWLTFNPGA